MKARLRYSNKVNLIHRSGGSVAIAELKVWEVKVSTHYPEGIKYSLFLVDPISGDVMFGIDNHQPKGPHLHLGKREEVYVFSTVDDLIEDFWRRAAEKGFPS